MRLIQCHLHYLAALRQSQSCRSWSYFRTSVTVFPWRRVLIDFVNRASIFLLSPSPQTLMQEPQLNAVELNPRVIDCNILLCFDGSFWSFPNRDFKGLKFDLPNVICWFVGFMTAIGLFSKMNHNRNYVSCGYVVIPRKTMDIFIFFSVLQCLS